MRPGGLLRANSPATREFIGGWLGNVRSALLSVVFPAGCRICEQLLTETTRIPICNDCLDSFGPITGTVCDKCGRPVEGAARSDLETFVCPTCANGEWRSYAFDRVRSWAVYEGVVVPVPLHRQRERERGYNQAALIAKPLAKLLGLPYKSGYSPESGRVPTSIC
jgi:competence protein ComFC